MTVIPVQSAKFSVVFPEGRLPKISPDDPRFVLDLDGSRIVGKLNAKSARKLAEHRGGAVLQGKLCVEAGHLTLVDAGFTWCDPKPVETEVIQPAADFANPPR